MQSLDMAPYFVLCTPYRALRTWDTIIKHLLPIIGCCTEYATNVRQLRDRHLHRHMQERETPIQTEAIEAMECRRMLYGVCCTPYQTSHHNNGSLVLHFGLMWVLPSKLSVETLDGAGFYP